MKKASILFTTVMVLSTVFFAFPLSSVANANSLYVAPSTSCGSVSDFDWPSWLKAATGGGSAFDPDASSYVIFMTTTSYSGFTADHSSLSSYSWEIYKSSDDTKPLLLSADTTTHGGTYQGVIYAQNGALLEDNYIEDYNYVPNPGSSTSVKQFTGSSWNSLPVGVSPAPAHGYLFSNNEVGCVLAAHNVIYAANYSAYDQPPGIAAYAAGVGASGSASTCSALNIGCWIGKAFNGVQNTLVSVAEAGISAITSLFEPNSTYLGDQFSSFYTFLQDKLGFIMYPVTFFVNFFNAYGDTSNNWCTDTSCVKDFGNFYGHDFNVNVTQIKTSFPTVWTLIVSTIRGLTVLAVVMAIRRKFIEVTEKS